MWQVLVYAYIHGHPALAVMQFGSLKAADVAVQRVKDMGLSAIAVPYNVS